MSNVLTAPLFRDVLIAMEAHHKFGSRGGTLVLFNIHTNLYNIYCSTGNTIKDPSYSLPFCTPLFSAQHIKTHPPNLATVPLPNSPSVGHHNCITIPRPHRLRLSSGHSTAPHLLYLTLRPYFIKPTQLWLQFIPTTL